jgi:CHAD domain-containing protein
MALDINRVQKPALKLRKLLRKLSKTPSIDAVHDFRTNARRLETTLKSLSLDSKYNGRRIVKKISKLRKRAGKVRDMDVLTGYASSVSLQNNDEKECVVRLLEYLGAKRKRHAEKLAQVKQQSRSELRKRLKRSAKDFGRILPKNGKGPPDREDPSRLIAASALRLLPELSEPVHFRKMNLHPYRLKVKELRNLLQMAENSDQQEFSHSLGEVKDAIGEWHDWEELVVIAKKVIDHKTECQLIRELQKTADQRYRKALELTEAMRRRFIRPSDHKATRSGRRSPAPQIPVLSAIAALTE